MTALACSTCKRSVSCATALPASVSSSATARKSSRVRWRTSRPFSSSDLSIWERALGVVCMRAATLPGRAASPCRLMSHTTCTARASAGVTPSGTVRDVARAW